MSYILAIESSGPVCSVAVIDLITGETLFRKEDNHPNQHSKILASFVAEGVSKQDTKPRAIAISQGPGSYTGLRIGTSLAKGLCAGFGIPLIAVPTLKAMCASYIDKNHVENHYTLLPMIDARRMEVYTAPYDNSLYRLSETAAVILEPSYFDTQKEYLIFGDGAGKVRELGPLANVTIDPNYYISADFVGRLALQSWHDKQFEEVHSFEPYYHKQFAAGKPKKWFV